MRRKTARGGQCIECRFFENNPKALEEALPGLNTLSSAYGSVRAEAGICSRHDLFLASWKSCKDFENSCEKPQGRMS